MRQPSLRMHHTKETMDKMKENHVLPSFKSDDGDVGSYGSDVVVANTSVWLKPWQTQSFLTLNSDGHIRKDL